MKAQQSTAGSRRERLRKQQSAGGVEVGGVGVLGRHPDVLPEPLNHNQIWKFGMIRGNAREKGR